MPDHEHAHELAHEHADAHEHRGHGGHGHAHGVSRELQRSALWIALAANAVFFGVEVVGGIVFHSLALLADAAHMLSDVAGLGIALIAQTLMSRPATDKHSYGLQRAEVLGAQLNGLTLIAASGWVLFEAVRRIGAPGEVSGGGLLVVAVLGLLVNLGSALVLARAQGSSLNMRGAFIHMAADAAGSVGVIIAGVAVVGWDAAWVDPAISIAIGVLVLWSAYGLLRDTTNVLLEGVPRGMRVAEVQAALVGAEGVDLVHHLHVWNLASDTPALSAHVVLSGEVSLHDAQVRGDALKAMLAARFGIDHVTLDLECHACDAPEDAQHGPTAAARPSRVSRTGQGSAPGG